MAVETFDVTNPAKPTIVKDPDATLDYTWDWTEWLDAISDVIASYEVFAYGSPPDITVGMTALQGGLIVAYLSGGTLNKTHPVTCRITTVGTGQPRIDDRTLYLKIRQR